MFKKLLWQTVWTQIRLLLKEQSVLSPRCLLLYTSSVSSMLQDLNWRTLDQRRIDSRLVLLYKVTYDLVAIPASDYLIRNTRPSSRNHPIAYRQITTLKDYYKFTFFPRTIIHWNALPHHIPTLPTLAQFSTAVCQVAL